MGYLVAQWERIRLPSRRYRFNPWVREIPQGKEMAIHSSILAWKSLWTEEPGELQSWGQKRIGRDLVTKE